MAKYFIHNNEQELNWDGGLLTNVPEGWTVVEYQNPGPQADISDAALAIETEAGLGISGHPSIVLQLSLYEGLYNSDETENTNRTMQWKCIHVNPEWSWTRIEEEISDFISENDAGHDALIALGQ